MSLALVISTRDNVATALEPLDAGQTIRAGEATITVAESIPRGHKIALRAIAAGEAVVKYGSAIGTASSAIAPGAHVHTHNVASTRGRGDLGVRPHNAHGESSGLSGAASGPDPGAAAGGRVEDPSAPRIAEPPDPDAIDATRGERSR
jgi:altronate dehydratase small subunit